MLATSRKSLLTGALVALVPLVTLVVATCALPGSARPAGTPTVRLVVDSAPGHDLTFVPDVILAPAATLIEVVFRNNSDQAHNLTFQAPLSAATRTIVEAGTSDAATFVTPSPGSYPFACTIHMGMTGTLTVE